jgi:hypothetical protein
MGKTKVAVFDETLVDVLSTAALVFTDKHFEQFADEVKLEGGPRDVARNIIAMLAHVASQLALSDPAAQAYLAGKAKTDG